MIDVNVRGVLYGIAAGLPRIKRQGFGQFVNVSSIGGHDVVAHRGRLLRHQVRGHRHLGGTAAGEQ